MSATAYALREIPLSSAPRQTRRIPLIEVPTGPLFSGEFETVFGYVVNLHGQGTYELAKQLATDNVPLLFERDYENEHDPNAVKAYTVSTRGRDFVGYVDSDTAAAIAGDLDKGAELIAYPQGWPRGGSGRRGGQLEISIDLR